MYYIDQIKAKNEKNSYSKSPLIFDFRVKKSLNLILKFIKIYIKFKQKCPSRLIMG